MQLISGELIYIQLKHKHKRMENMYRCLVVTLAGATGGIRDWVGVRGSGMGGGGRRGEGNRQSDEH